MKPGHTPEAARQALHAFRLLAQRSPREQAEERMRRAKARMTQAAQALIDGSADAAALGDRARAELRAAQFNLQRVEGEEQSENG
jgi:hypothetical protein